MIVWLASYPRSGNTFFRVILNSVFELKTYSVYDDRYDIGADEATSDVVGHVFLPDDSTSMQEHDDAQPGWSMPTATIEKMRKDKELYIVKTHELQDEFIHPEDKVIYLLRDGRESTLSFWKYSVDFIASKKSLNEFIASGAWGAHVRSWNPASRDNTLLVKFEELIDDPEKMISKISDFIEAKPKGGEIPTFEELKKINPKFFRSGKKSSWQDIYSTKDHELFWEKNSEEMIKYGYTEPLPEGYVIDGNKLLPKVTVVTVSYNAEKEIERTIQSVLGQTYPHVEYIIIDGASTDGTVDIIKKYEDKLGYWISEPDEGIYYAMNKAIDKASGKWVNFMNAGDTFTDESVIERMIKQSSSDADIYYGSRYIISDNNSPILQQYTSLHTIYQKMPFGHQASFTKKEILKKLKFDISYKLSADYDFFIRAYRDNFSFHELDFPVCNFHTGGLSYQRYTKSIFETLKILSDYVNDEGVENSIYYKNFIKKITYKARHQYETTIKVLRDKMEDCETKQCTQKHNKEIVQNFNSMVTKLDQLSNLKFYKTPIKKYRAYKQALNTYLSLPKQIFSKTYLLPTDNLQSQPFKTFCISEEEQPIMIFQVGKVGSSTMAKSLKNRFSNLPIYQIHNIQTANELLEKEKQLKHMGGFYHFSTGMELKNIIAKYPDIKWKVIIGIREPIKRWVSDIFQNIDERYAYFYNLDGTIKQEELLKFIKKTLETEPMQVWFQEELEPTFNINIFQYDFDKTKGYTIISKNNVEILIYQLEKLKESFSIMMEEFLDLKLEYPYSANQAKDKAYASDYNFILQKLKFDEKYLRTFYKKPVTSHFYSNTDIENFINIWKK